MEQYKEKLKLSRSIAVAAGAILAAFSILAFASESGLIELTPVAGDNHWQSMWRGMVCGASFALAAMLFAGSVRIGRALKNESDLKKLYIKENDERQIKIWTSARAAAMQVFLYLGLAAGMIAGYFSMAVGITILACVVTHSLIGLALKLYYSKKF